MHQRETKMEAFGQLLDVMSELRAKCPWDKKQTFDSLRPLTIEETYELSQAIVDRQYGDVCKELGDLMLHLVFYAKVAEEQQLFDIQDVLEQICSKLKYRHPHIYGDVQADTASEVAQNWEKLKLKEKGGNKSVLAGVPESMPSVIKAFRMQDKARGVGFDWMQPEGAWSKLKEELSEVEAEMMADDAATPEGKQRLEAEFGDLLFSLINVARLHKINPDNALERTNKKFRFRFNYVEEQITRQGRNLSEATLDEMETYWQQAKKQL